MIQRLLSTRTLVAALALGALVMFASPFATTASAAGKAVNVEVEVQGDVPGITQDDVEELCESLFQAAGETVSEEDGPDVLVVHLLIAADDDGSGFTIHVAAGAFKGDVDFDSADSIDEALHDVVEDVDGDDDDE